MQQLRETWHMFIDNRLGSYKASEDRIRTHKHTHANSQRQLYIRAENNVQSCKMQYKIKGQRLNAYVSVLAIQ